MADSKTSRRMIIAGAAAAAVPAAAEAQGARRTVHWSGEKPSDPLFSPVVTFGNVVFVAGKGAHFEGDIKAHTDHVLNTLKEELERVGSSMDKVLKCNVYLHDLADYQAMNEVFRGRFGENPPVRTTIAAAGGIPGNSLVEIDVIAYV